ncbi:MAG: FAD-binding oxidoreductase [Caldisphaera sp.]
MSLDKNLMQLKNDLGVIIGEKYVSINTFERIKNTLDPMPYRINREAMPYAVILPGTKEEVSEIFKYANKNKIPIFIRGSGTQLNGASRPHIPGIVLLTRRMKKIEIIEEGGYFECECGARCGEVTDQLQKKGYYLPIYPGSRVIASMGGLVSNNTSGHLTDTYTGKPADYVLGLEVVLPTGEIIETGTIGLRKPAGTDLTKWFAGGDGILGFIYKIRMRLLPLLKRSYGVAIFQDLKHLAKGVQRIYLDKRPLPIFMEFMSKNISDIGFEVKGLNKPLGPVLLAVTEGFTKEEASKKIDGLMKSFQEEKAIEAYRVDNMDEWEKLWSTREVIGSYVMQVQKGKLITSELSGNLKDLVEIMDDAEHFNQGLKILSNFQPLLFGHIGALTIHVSFLLPANLPDEQLKEATDELFRKEAEINLKYLTCGGEWGQFSKRKDFFIKRYGQKSYDIVKDIKRVFDPNNILNPGILEGIR